MQGVYLNVNAGPSPSTPSTPTRASTPASQQYITTMKKYSPKFVYSQEALQGYESAALLVAGVKAAGNDLTQQNVIAQTNKLSDFPTAGGVRVPCRTGPLPTPRRGFELQFVRPGQGEYVRPRPDQGLAGLRLLQQEGQSEESDSGDLLPPRHPGSLT